MSGWALDDEVVAEDVPRSDCWSGPAAGRMGRREGRRRKTGLHRPQHRTDDMGRPPRSVSRGRSPSSPTVVRIPWALLLLTTVVFILRISTFYLRRCLVNCGWKTVEFKGSRWAADRGLIFTPQRMLCIKYMTLNLIVKREAIFNAFICY